MVDRELRKLRRTDLLDVLVQQAQENDRLKKELENKDRLIEEYQAKSKLAETTARAVSEIKEAIKSENRIIQEIRRQQEFIGALYFGTSEEFRAGDENVGEKPVTDPTPAQDAGPEEARTGIGAQP